MGKVTDAMRSKITPNKRRKSALYTAPSPPDTPQGRPKLPSFDFEPFAPPIPPPKSPRVRDVPPVPPRKEPSFTFPASTPQPRDQNIGTSIREWQEGNRLVSAQADVAASLAMLDFELKLPLGELGDIGQPPKTYSRATSEATPRTLWTPQEARDATSRGTGVQSGRRSSARTLSLSTPSSHSSFSFACRDARRTERKYAQEIETSSVGSLDGWGVGPDDEEIQGPPNNGHAPPSPPQTLPILSSAGSKHPSFMSDEELAALPDYSDVEDDPEYEEPYVPDSDAWSVTSKGSKSSEELAMPMVDDVPASPELGIERLNDGSYASAIKEMELIVESERLKAIQAGETTADAE